jgi:hypothetical protein
MKKFGIREVETVKTTAALYACSACPWICGGWPPIVVTA